MKKSSRVFALVVCMFLLTAGSGFAAVQDSDEVCMAEGGIETETTAPEEISPGVPAYVSALSAVCFKRKGNSNCND